MVEITSASALIALSLGLIICIVVCCCCLPVIVAHSCTQCKWFCDICVLPTLLLNFSMCLVCEYLHATGSWPFTNDDDTPVTRTSREIDEEDPILKMELYPEDHQEQSIQEGSVMTEGSFSELMSDGDSGSFIDSEGRVKVSSQTQVINNRNVVYNKKAMLYYFKMKGWLPFGRQLLSSGCIFNDIPNLIEYTDSITGYLNEKERLKIFPNHEKKFTREKYIDTFDIYRLKRDSLFHWCTNQIRKYEERECETETMEEHEFEKESYGEFCDEESSEESDEEEGEYEYYDGEEEEEEEGEDEFETVTDYSESTTEMETEEDMFDVDDEGELVAKYKTKVTRNRLNRNPDRDGQGSTGQVSGEEEEEIVSEEEEEVEGEDIDKRNQRRRRKRNPRREKRRREREERRKKRENSDPQLAKRPEEEEEEEEIEEEGESDPEIQNGVDTLDESFSGTLNEEDRLVMYSPYDPPPNYPGLEKCMDTVRSMERTQHLDDDDDDDDEDTNFERIKSSPAALQRKTSILQLAFSSKKRKKNKTVHPIDSSKTVEKDGINDPVARKIRFPKVPSQDKFEVDDDNDDEKTETIGTDHELTEDESEYHDYIAEEDLIHIVRAARSSINEKDTGDPRGRNPNREDMYDVDDEVTEQSDSTLSDTNTSASQYNEEELTTSKISKEERKKYNRMIREFTTQCHTVSQNVTLDEDPVIKERYINFSEKGTVLGVGSYGSVYRGDYRVPGTNRLIEVALKGVQADTEKEKEALKREVSVMMSSHHRNIVRCYGVMFQKKKAGTEDHVSSPAFIVLERGIDSLKSFIQKHRWLIGRVRRIRFSLDVAQGMKYIHANKGFVHLDLKPENVIIFKDKKKRGGEFVAKITDFGACQNFRKKKKTGNETGIILNPSSSGPIVPKKSRLDEIEDEVECETTPVESMRSEEEQNNEKEKKKTTSSSSKQPQESNSDWGFVGTPEYVAPEIIDQQRQRIPDPRKCDIYSFGILMWSCYSGRTPFYNLRRKKGFKAGWNDFAFIQYIHQIQTTNKNDQQNEKSNGRGHSIFGRRKSQKVNQKKGVRPTVKRLSRAPKGYERLMRRCWQANPKNRPRDFGEICMKLESVIRVLMNKRDLLRKKYYDSGGSTTKRKVSSASTRVIGQLFGGKKYRKKKEREKKVTTRMRYLASLREKEKLKRYLEQKKASGGGVVRREGTFAELYQTQESRGRRTRRRRRRRRRNRHGASHGRRSRGGRGMSNEEAIKERKRRKKKKKRKKKRKRRR